MDIDETIASLESNSSNLRESYGRTIYPGTGHAASVAKELDIAVQHLRRLRDALAGIVSASDKNEGMGYRPLNHVLLATARAALNEVAE